MTRNRSEKLSAAFAVTAGALLVACGLLAMGGCASTPDPKDGPTSDVSNLPWNRQESWEGNPYGAFMPGSR